MRPPGQSRQASRTVARPKRTPIDAYATGLAELKDVFESSTARLGMMAADLAKLRTAYADCNGAPGDPAVAAAYQRLENLQASLGDDLQLAKGVWHDTQVGLGRARAFVDPSLAPPSVEGGAAEAGGGEEVAVETPPVADDAPAMVPNALPDGIELVFALADELEDEPGATTQTPGPAPPLPGPPPNGVGGPPPPPPPMAGLVAKRAAAKKRVAEGPSRAERIAAMEAENAARAAAKAAQDVLLETNKRCVQELESVLASRARPPVQVARVTDTGGGRKARRR